ncbi:PREDICTED: dynein heavy chain 2, axonemal [Nicrophorus vespilloides]|uniref:Dynein heavy chain 2, axonemal n=1 Tax=Nicrophorus vespilloides TaxID=110193 RepID=A0ABM1MDX2_NICVS|nr:PREDICTED: dynein heavy chain 2, axonemal [Nicrophorus vespilloides]
MSPCSISEEVFLQYESLISSIDELVLNLFRRFNENVGEDVTKRLDRPLMCRSASRPGLIECNMDKKLLQIFQEIRYFLAMKYEVPSNCNYVWSKVTSLKFIFENVVQVVRDYNNLIASLGDEERVLFKQLILNVEKKISPGLSKLTWNTDLGDAYIAECSACTSDLQDFVTDYKTCNLEIVAICEKICDSPIIHISSGVSYDMDVLFNIINKSREETIDKFIEYYQQIIRYLIVVYEGFEQNIQNMAEQWIKYIIKFDILMEEALRVTVKNSLQHVYETLHGDGVTGPNPVLNLETHLKHNKINFVPTLSSFATHMADILPSITLNLTAVPRISEKFHIKNARIRSFSDLINSDAECNKLQKLINKEVQLNVDKMREYMQMWMPFRDLWELNKDLFIDMYEKENPTASQFDANIGRYTELANNVQIIENVTIVYFIIVDCNNLKKSIIDHCIKWQEKLTALLFKITKRMVNWIYKYTKENSEKVMVVPQNLKEMQNAILFYERLVDEAPKEEKAFVEIIEQTEVLDKYGMEIPDEVRKNMKGIPQIWEAYLLTLEEADKMIEFTKNGFRNNLLEESEDIKREACNLLDTFMTTGPFSHDVKVSDAKNFLKMMRENISKLREREALVKENLGIFELSLMESQDLNALEKEMLTLEIVWGLTEEWDIAWNKYKTGEFWGIQTDDMEETAQTLFRKLTKLARELKEKNWSIVEHTRQRVDAFRRTLPLIGDLKNPAMRPRHWDRVRAAMYEDFDQNSPAFNLEAILAMRMIDYAEQINEISNAATMELLIEKGIKAIADTWKLVTIEMAPYKGFFRIKSVDDCFQMLEDNMMQLSTMKSTRFVEPFAKEVDMWERRLSYIMETLETALNVQRQWLYLENIFGGEDIRRQMPKETLEFDGLTDDWKEISTRMAGGKNAMRCVTFIPAPQLLNKLNKMNDKLELIQRALELYLETKRHVFPRFYFISNDDMLEILGNAKKPEAVQPHFKKLFDNLNKLKLQKNAITMKSEAIGMISEDGEYMEFTKMVIIDGQVENWLNDVESMMRFTLKTEFKPCRAALRKMLSKRDKWLLSYCGQLCNACSQMQWTTDCTRALVHCKLTESKKPLKRLRKKQNRILLKLSELSRRELPKLQRLKANTLITIEIHSRDVIDRMYRANCMDTGAFEWFSQLRFYWDREIDDCIIRQTNTHFLYGYEYNGNSGRLVITPLTDRCYITLTTALHLFRGGSPKGPAGTGKTETVKDLGKAMGMWVIVNNCSEGLDFKSMGKCFSGLAQTGAWGCFDEFNRINIEVLSVVAQQIMCILAAISQRVKTFIFEGIEINLKHSCGIFITMNPGYAGRTELPDNVKSMFRPISMMVPDSVIIAENTLFSDGFQNARVLAKKVFTLYQLSIRQLSKQDHYDFGLRSMVALLRYAGKKRRQLSHLPEEEIVYLAMKDMNIAKLTADDLPLFNGIMSDIFPGISLPSVDYEDMNAAISGHLKENGLQCIATALTKVIQLYETKNSRHSVMILGRTGTAKTVTWKALQGCMGRLKRAGKPGFQVVHEYPINPKALNLAELYGEYNLSTNEWLDGVISSIMRITCAEESPDEKWILFDGPVDAVWIENMNSVMDDNKVLTLINSDRITMPEQVSLLFEVGDLTVASPATVSRCGMVYNDYKDWGWQPFVTSWLQKVENRGKDYITLMKYYFNYYLNTILEFKRLNCQETIVTSELNLVVSFCKLLEMFATKENGIDITNEETFEDMIKIWFLFCMIWSVCGTVDENGRRKMDTFIREKEGVFPLKDTIYEYYVDIKNKCFAPWEEKLNMSWRYDEGLPYHKIVVPTIDTVRYEYLISALLDKGYPVLLTGPVGTGKTSSAQSVLNSMDKDKYVILNINMSAQTTSLNVQEAIESRTEKRTKNSYAPPGGKFMITFMDDLNMPAKETYGSQPPLELLRQWIDYGFWYDRQKQWRKYVQNMLVMAGMGPPGGGRNVISQRLQSKFNLINMTFPAEATIFRIFGTMIMQHTLDFIDEVKSIARNITNATIELYDNVINKMLPTPTKIHYLFNLRDISKVFQGLLRSHKDIGNNKPFMLKLWIHECIRVFYDRLIDEKDREWFLNQLNEQLGRHFELTFHAICTNREIPMFGDFIHAFSLYDDLNDLTVVRKHLEVQMEEYNASPNVVRMDLVLFKDAIDHICRIVRVVSQQRGNMLLVGIGGSGRQSVSRIAAYLAELSTFQITVTRSYKVVEFKEDLKKLFSLSGVDGRPTSFLFNDTQVTDEGFLEIINNMLSTGEVANLYKTDEFEEIKAKLYKAAVKAGIVQTNEGYYNFLIQRIRTNLHIILCMSPIGEAFRNRLRQYPGLINCTTIDWFCDWPVAALLEVAHKYIADVNFVESITGQEQEKRRDSLVFSTQDRLLQAVATIFATIHASVGKYAKRMASELKRHCYVTPVNYIELVAGFKIMLDHKRRETASEANKLRNGLWKIEDCRIKVETMSAELADAQIQVNQYQEECEEYMVIIVQQQKEADEQAKEVEVTRIKISEEEVVCKKLADVAQADLDQAMPALEEAIRALDSLNKKDISEMKSYSKPPQKVEMVMEAVMILKQLEPTWTEAKRQLGEQKFLDDLREFDKNHISEKTLKKINVYTTNDEFVPDKIGVVSLAAKSLCMWVIAIEKYAKVWKYVAPKQAKLDDAKASLAEKQRLLAEAQAKLDELQRKLEELQAAYEDKVKLKEELNKKAELLRIKLERASMLVENLGGEKIRWENTVANLDTIFEWLPGDCLLGTAFVSYLGPFVSNYRDDMIKYWIQQIIELDIPSNPDFEIIKFLTDPTSIREWIIQGLPSDDFSTENGIIVVRGTRWPLVIDPQCQAQKWIKAMEMVNELKVIDFGMPDFMKIVEQSVQLGRPVLLQNISETMDPSLNPILDKAVVKQGGMMMIKLDDRMVSYDEHFRFFITTKLNNPHYPPEISTKTTLVNFAIKQKGLEAQLLGIIVRKEKPQLEEQKDDMVTSIAKGKRTLIELENDLLRLLNETRGSLLEDADLFNTLQTSKQTSITVQKNLEISEETEVEIDAAREGYRSCAERASILFFVLNDMGQIDPMYQFALDAYVFLFTQSIDRSTKSQILDERIEILNEFHTYAVYKNTCRAIFERHKLLFSFHMCIKILEGQGKIISAEYNFLLKGGVVLDRENQVDNPCSWMDGTSWDNITEMDKVGGFHGVVTTFEQFPRDWYQWYIHTEPETQPLLGEWEDICSEFQKMLFIRSLRMDRISFCVSTFIVNQLGSRFVEPPVLDVKQVLQESVAQTPLIFVLSPGVDPTNSLVQLAETSKMTSRFHALSLGQGQAPIATRMLATGAKEGNWVFLANCHLSLSWMPKLDKIVETLQIGKVNPKFRLWLSSSPHPEFPISILQAAIKMTTEPPRGIKANLKRLYQIVTEEQFNLCHSKEKYKKLLFSLCFFHSVLLERKKFQELGWNVVYSFNDSDFEVSENLLTIYLDEYQNITPWDALKYLIAGVNYGGHVTDDWDRRVLLTYINHYFCEDALNTPLYRLSSLGTYYIPRDGSLQSYQDYITLLPNVDRPEAFGQHPNADITSLISETRSLFGTLMSLQVQASGSEEESKEEKVSQLASDVLSKIPEPIDYENTEKLMGPMKSPLDVVLLQEISRYNVLLIQIRISLDELQKGIKGLVVMSTELEEIFTCFYDGRVPSSWLKAYPSLKLLGSWTRDLIRRIDHFETWAETTHPPLLFWLASYTFPTGFLTAVLQTTARMMEVPIDTLNWEFTVLTTDDNSVQLRPDVGVYVRGLFLEGAGWDKKNSCLIEPQPMQLVCPMPLIHFKPIEQLKKKTKGLYSSPCYYYPIRTGTQGWPSFVVAVDLKSGVEHSDFWVKRGTALLLSLST